MSEVSQVTALEQQREQTKNQVERRDMALRLYENRDFRALILDGFCRDECARYVQQSANPALDKTARKDSLRFAQAAGAVKAFLSIVCQQGDISARNLADIDEALAEARAEEDQG